MRTHHVTPILACPERLDPERLSSYFILFRIKLIIIKQPSPLGLVGLWRPAVTAQENRDVSSATLEAEIFFSLILCKRDFF